MSVRNKVSRAAFVVLGVGIVSMCGANIYDAFNTGNSRPAGSLVLSRKVELGLFWCSIAYDGIVATLIFFATVQIGRGRLRINSS